MTHWMEGDWPDNCEIETDEAKLMKKAVLLIRKLSQVMPSLSPEIDELIGELECVADDIDGMFEDNDPRSMGWAGDNGLP